MNATPPSTLHRSTHDVRRRGFARAIVEPSGLCTERSGEREQRASTRLRGAPANELADVSAAQSSEEIELIQGEARLDDIGDQEGDPLTRGAGLGHVTYERSHDVQASVNDIGASSRVDGDIRRVSAAPLPDPMSPQAIAARIRRRLQELGLSESSFAEAEQKDRTTLSTQLRRLDQGGNMRQDTLIRLSKYLGKPVHWILTGEDVVGVPLSEMAGWPEGIVEVRERHTFSNEDIEAAGRIRLPTSRKLDALAISGFIMADIASRRLRQS